MNRVYCRMYQGVLKLAMPFMPWRRPELLEGAGSLLRLPALIRGLGLDRVLLVTGPVIASLGLPEPLLQGLAGEGIHCAVYAETVQNPTIDNIEAALALYHAQRCQGIIAFGGGSPMDCAKGVGARLARPDRTIPEMKGILRVRKPLPPLFAIPTTAGSGSETTLAAVITDSRTHEKYALSDWPLIPHYAVLDPGLTAGLPPKVTATTGMDALTHAVEAYIGRSNTKETRAMAREAVRLIFQNLEAVYADGSNLAARAGMQRASFCAGVAFTRAYVGYVHAIAHSLGGRYNVPHGLANAVLLPHVLRRYGNAVRKPLAELADLAGLSEAADNAQQKSHRFILAIDEMNARMGIPGKIAQICPEDIPAMARRAAKEANPLYPVPRLMDADELAEIYRLVMPSR